MKRPIIAGNWKMNLSWPEANKLVSQLTQKLSNPVNIDIILFPSFTFLRDVHTLLNGSIVKIGGQNMCCKVKGAYTGEVSAEMLVDSGCSYVLLGHSERRTYFGETDRIINEKLHLALDNKLTPVLCVGETLEEQESNQTKNILKDQIFLCFHNVKAHNLRQIIIAYEPLWAIGTGKNATPEQVLKTHDFIRLVLEELYDSEASSQMRIIYGGSVNPQNGSDLLAQKGIDGLLIGSASLIADSFYAIIDSITEGV